MPDKNASGWITKFEIIDNWSNFWAQIPASIPIMANVIPPWIRYKTIQKIFLGRSIIPKIHSNKKEAVKKLPQVLTKKLKIKQIIEKKEPTVEVKKLPKLETKKITNNDIKKLPTLELKKSPWT